MSKNNDHTENSWQSMRQLSYPIYKICALPLKMIFSTGEEEEEEEEEEEPKKH